MLAITFSIKTLCFFSILALCTKPAQLPQSQGAPDHRSNRSEEGACACGRAKAGHHVHSLADRRRQHPWFLNVPDHRPSPSSDRGWREPTVTASFFCPFSPFMDPTVVYRSGQCK
jgi:hypothetical protein